MSLTYISSIIREGVYYTIITATPILLSAIFIGLIISIFQAVTSIQEQTLTFVPKFIVIMTILFILSPWMFTNMQNYTIHLFERIGKF